MDKSLELQFLKEITEAKGISGDEKEVSRVMKKYLDGYVDEFDYDNLGSLIAKKTGNDNLILTIPDTYKKANIICTLQDVLNGKSEYYYPTIESIDLPKLEDGRYLGFVWVDGVLLNLELVELAYTNSTLSSTRCPEIYKEYL